MYYEANKSYLLLKHACNTYLYPLFLHTIHTFITVLKTLSKSINFIAKKVSSLQFGCYVVVVTNCLFIDNKLLFKLKSVFHRSNIENYSKMFSFWINAKDVEKAKSHWACINYRNNY